MTPVRPTRGKVALGLEPLETRCNPATSGVPWPDGHALTLSFVPDGTLVGGTPSRMMAALDATAPRAVWQGEIVRAFREWAGHADLAIRVRSDGGQPLGTAGAVEGDARFGDIRIAAVDLPAGTLATNTPFQWSGTTWSGDVVLNTHYRFGTDRAAGRYDLYSAMLNEAGNVFGVLDTRTDRTSAVFHRYVGRRTGLSAADIADIQSLYGPPADGPSGHQHAGPFQTFHADRTADTVTARAPDAAAHEKLNVIVWTATGETAPSVEVFAAADPGRPLPARVLAADGGTYSVELDDAVPGEVYLLRFAGAESAGGYDVAIDFNSQPATEQPDGAAFGTTTQRVCVARNQLYQFALPAADGTVRADVTAAAGRVVAALAADADHAATVHAYLPAGVYAVRVAPAPPGSRPAVLTGRVASDPIGPGYTDTPDAEPTSTVTIYVPPPDPTDQLQDQPGRPVWERPHRI